MATLTEVLESPTRKQAVLDDAGRLLDAEVQARSGLTGMGVKAGFAAVKAVKPGIVPELLESLVPDFCRALDPLLAGRAPDGPSVSAFLSSRPGEVAQALLAVTDARAEKTTHKSLLSVYRKLRPVAQKQVEQSVPGLAKLVETHLTRHEAALAAAAAPPATPAA